MKPELVSLLGEDTVALLNSYAQLAAFALVVIGISKVKSFELLSSTLRRLAELHKFFFYSKVSTTLEDVTTGKRSTAQRSATALIVYTGPLLRAGSIIEDPSGNQRVIEEKREDLPMAVYLVISAVLLAFLFITEESVLYWAAAPFRQLAEAFEIWGTVTLSWTLFLVPLKSFLFFVWAMVLMGLVYTFGFGVSFKLIFRATDWMALRLSEGRFSAMVSLGVVAFGAVALATSADLRFT